VSERTSWQRIARRIRVPLGFVFAALFLGLARPTWKTMALSLLLVVPGLWLRAYAAGYVKKNAEITRTGPYAYTRNPLYLGSMMIAFGFAWASGSWAIFVALAVGFLRSTCRRFGRRKFICGSIFRALMSIVGRCRGFCQD